MASEEENLGHKINTVLYTLSKGDFFREVSKDEDSRSHNGIFVASNCCIATTTYQ